jgi:thiamine-phosphate pyrophosphorylase
MARQPQIPARPPCRLYLITPAAIPDLDAFAADLETALASGDCAALQIRLKEASDEEIQAAVARLKPICQTHDVALILNDRPDLARATGCDGVHVEDAAELADALARALAHPRPIVVEVEVA